MKAKLLLTGASGFIGSQIYKALKNDFEITAISSSNNNDYTLLNLLDENDCKSFFKGKTFDIVIHAAAIAHGKNNVNTISVGKANTLITENVFSNLNVANTNIVYLSSVSVYSYKNSNDVISVNDKPIPVTEYGKSKLESENIIKSFNPRALHILRLAPVFDKDNLKDIKKRVFLPGINKAFLTKEKRLYSLCNISNVVNNVKILVKDDRNSLLILKDSDDYSQKELLSWFGRTKPEVVISQKIIQKLSVILGFFPFSKIDIIRDMLNKLFFSVTYKNS